MIVVVKYRSRTGNVKFSVQVEPRNETPESSDVYAVPRDVEETDSSAAAAATKTSTSSHYASSDVAVGKPRCNLGPALPDRKVAAAIAEAPVPKSSSLDRPKLGSLSYKPNADGSSTQNGAEAKVAPKVALKPSMKARDRVQTDPEMVYEDAASGHTPHQSPALQRKDTGPVKPSYTAPSAPTTSEGPNDEPEYDKVSLDDIRVPPRTISQAGRLHKS